MGVNWNEVDRAIANGFAAYGAVSDIKQQRADQRASAATKAKRAEIAGLMAQGPAQTQQALPSQQSAMLKEQTADLVSEPAIPAQGAMPPQPPGAYQSSVPTSDDPDVAAMEADIQASTGRQVMQTEDWKSFEDNLLQKTAALGDPSAVAEMKKYVDQIKQKGFNENAGKAATAAASGQDAQVEHFLSKAWGYMDTGTTASVVAVPNKPGVYMVTPVSESETAQDGSPKPAGQPIVMNAAMIGSMAQMAADPAKFWQLQQKFEQEAASGARQDKRIELEKSRLPDAEDKKLDKDKKRADTKKSIADAKKAEAAVTGKTTWNKADERAVTSDVTRYITTRKEGSDELYTLYEESGNQIAEDTIDLAKALKDYNLPRHIEIAEKIAATEGAKLYLDDQGQPYIVVGDNEYELDEL